MSFVLTCPKGLESHLQAELKQLGVEKSETGSAAVLFDAPEQTAMRVMLYTRLGSRLMQTLGKVRFKREKELYDELRRFPFDAWMSPDQTFRIQTSLEKSRPGERPPLPPESTSRGPVRRGGPPVRQSGREHGAHFGRSHEYGQERGRSQGLRPGGADRGFSRQDPSDRPNPGEFENSGIKINTLYLSQVAKDAVVDIIREKEDERPNVELKNPDFSFHIHLRQVGDGFKGELLLDWSGRALSHRGYRLRGFEAPLRENLGAGIEHIMKWDGKEVFWDQMCGSGTLLIESAWKLLGVAPSYLRLKSRRPYSIENLKTFKFKGPFQDMKRQALERSEQALEDQSKIKGRIFGSDLSEESLNATRKNLVAADLDPELFGLREMDALDPTDLPAGPGIVFANPPYGERMNAGDEEALADLYTELGEAWKNNLKGFRGYIFTGRPELRKVIRLRTSERHILYNGAIECRLFRYDLN